MRDVDITYDVTRPQQPRTRERVRWLAGEHLERVEGSGRSITIFDRDAHAVTLLTPANRTYRKLDGAPRRPLEPEPGAILKRGNDSVVAGLTCTDWSWTEDVETHTVCATADGVMLRFIVDGATFFEARSVKYAPQKAELFSGTARLCAGAGAGGRRRAVTLRRLIRLGHHHCCRHVTPRGGIRLSTDDMLTTVVMYSRI